MATRALAAPFVALALAHLAAGLVAPRKVVAPAHVHLRPHGGAQCWQKVAWKHHSSLTQLGQMMQKRAELPGAGVEPVVPFKQVLKDGYLLVDCVKDYMLWHGDLHSKHKAEYELKDVANVSIVHYTEIIPKEDREQMTPEVCFNFCRTVPDMGYFGITNGRDCYCEPYYTQMAGDSSSCDAVCEGEQTSFCGGKFKSSIWEMHSCADTAKVLETITRDSQETADVLKGNATAAAKLAQDASDVAAALQTTYGSIGDPVASDLLQKAKVRGGELIHLGEEGKALATAISDNIKKAKGMLKYDFTQSDKIKEAEAVIKELQAQGKEGKEKLKLLLEELAYYNTPVIENATSFYYPLMYFVDKAFVNETTTCGGELATKPLFMPEDKCATTCYNLLDTCDGYSSYPHSEGGDICFLFSKITSAQHYSGCAELPPAYPQCKVKVSEFEGTTLKPDPSGKCEHCLKEVVNAARCPL